MNRPERLARPTNASDVQMMARALGAPTPRSLTYADINRATSIEDLLGNEGAAILLVYNSLAGGKPFGHWMSITRRVICPHPRGLIGPGGIRYKPIDFSDSYGSEPDAGITGGHIPADIRQRFDIIEPRLYALLAAYPGEVTWSEYPLQARSPHIQTCGRWAAARVAMRDLTPDEFAHVFQAEARAEHRTPDDIVVDLTSALDK